MVRLSSPLLGEASARLETRRHRRSFMAMVVVGSLALLCIGLAMRKQLPMGPRAPLLLQSRGPKANLMRQLYAEQLLQHGEELQAQATKEIKLGQQLAAANGLKPRQGMMLSSNDTDPCNGMDVGCRGVTVDMWPHNWEVKQLPGYKKVNETDDANSTLSAVYEDYDYYNRKPLRDAGVNIGTWFWEPDDIDAPPRNESEGPSPEEKAADEELERILKKEENATTPEERLERAGVKLIGMPWDPNIDWRSYYNEDLEEDNEGGEGEESGSGEGEESGSSEEGAAEKSHPTFLKMQKHSQVLHAKFRPGMGLKSRPSATHYVGARSMIHHKIHHKAAHHPEHNHAAHRVMKHHKIDPYLKSRALYMKGIAAYQKYRQQVHQKKLQTLGIA